MKKIYINGGIFKRRAVKFDSKKKKKKIVFNPNLRNI